jgi:hypothetical protein
MGLGLCIGLITSKRRDMHRETATVGEQRTDEVQRGTPPAGVVGNPSRARPPNVSTPYAAPD